MLCGQIRELMIWYTFLFLSSYENMKNSSFIPSYKGEIEKLGLLH